MAKPCHGAARGRGSSAGCTTRSSWAAVRPGSTCARVLVAGGARVAVLDRAEFPRVKLCAGWLSPPFWDVVGISPASYPRGLWEWNTCHVQFHGEQFALPGKGWFIRRYELDDYLLRTLRRRAPPRHERQGHRSARTACGTSAACAASCSSAPAARTARSPACSQPQRPRRAVGVQELELPADPIAVARTRLGNDGEPELVLFDDISRLRLERAQARLAQRRLRHARRDPRPRRLAAHARAPDRAPATCPPEAEPSSST